MTTAAASVKQFQHWIGTWPVWASAPARPAV